MWMDEGLDTGAIIQTMTLKIAPDEMVESLYDTIDCYGMRFDPGRYTYLGS